MQQAVNGSEKMGVVVALVTPLVQSRLEGKPISKPVRNLQSVFHCGLGQSVVQLTGHSARWSGRQGVSKGLIVVIVNGGGRGVACRVVSQKEKYETEHCSRTVLGGPPRGHRQVCGPSPQGSSEQSQEASRGREPLRSSVRRRQGPHGSNLVSSQRPDARTGCQGMPLHVQGGAKAGGRVRSDGAERI